MGKSKTKAALALLLALLMLPNSAMAAFSTPQPVTGHIKYEINPRIIDTSFDLDFESSTMWTIDFQNNLYGHSSVKVVYNSNTPTNKAGLAWITLHIDEDGDGVYEAYDPNGGYTFSLKYGETLNFDLPYGPAIMDYRVVFTNRTSSVISGNFSIKTY